MERRGQLPDEKEFPRMYERIETFLRKWDAHELSLNELGKTIYAKNPYTGDTSDLIGHLGYLITEYRRLSDLCYSMNKRFSTDSKFLATYEKASLHQLNVAQYLLQAIELAYSYKIVDEKLPRNFEDLETKSANLEKDLLKCREENKKLQANLEGLQRLLEKNLPFQSTVERDDDGEGENKE